MEANYLTILYWFCHTSTWIHHECTRVPHPESPSHLPPWISTSYIFEYLKYLLLILISIADFVHISSSYLNNSFLTNRLASSVSSVFPFYLECVSPKKKKKNHMSYFYSKPSSNSLLFIKFKLQGMPFKAEHELASTWLTLPWYVHCIYIVI